MSGRDERPINRLQCPFCQHSTAFWILTDTRLGRVENWGWLMIDKEYWDKKGEFLDKPRVEKYYLKNLNNIDSIRCRSSHLKVSHLDECGDSQHDFSKDDAIFKYVIEMVNKCVR